MPYKIASDLRPGDGVEVPGLRGQVVKSVEPFDGSITEALTRGREVLGGAWSGGTLALWVLWESGYRTVIAADYELTTFDPAQRRAAEALADAVMVRIIREALK